MKEKMLKAMGRLIEYEVNKSNNGWPPCAGFIYQPKRPIRNQKINNKKKEKIEN